MTSKRSKPAATVLIVDDEDQIRRMFRRALEAAGYRVFEASSGREGLTVLERQTHIDLLVTDLQMPDMRGDEMARQFRLSRPGLKVLYATGFADQLFDARGRLLEGEAFLEKPFTPAELLAVASAMLDRSLPNPTTWPPSASGRGTCRPYRPVFGACEIAGAAVLAAV
jgi:CheY-like chemotaxis protein